MPTLRICFAVALAVVFAGLCFGADTPKRVTLLDPAKAAEYEKSPKVAIVVGIGAYPAESGFGPLRYAANDAIELSGRLKGLGYQVVTLLDQQATRNIVKKSLDNVATMIDSNEGTVLFFFSGHGFQRGGANYLATYESALSALGSSGVAVTDVESVLRKSGAPRRVLWLDACRNDPGRDAKGSENMAARSYSRLSAEKGTLILYSAEAAKLSYENDQLQHGVFTSFLLRGLDGDAAGPDQMITFDDLASYVVPKVREYSFERGQTQVPQRAGEASGDFLIAKGVQLQMNVNISGADGRVDNASVISGPKDLRDRLSNLQARADTASGYFEGLASQLKAQGAGLRPAILSSLNTVKRALSQAAAEIAQGRNADAQQSMNAAEAALQELEKIYRR